MAKTGTLNKSFVLGNRGFSNAQNARATGDAILDVEVELAAGKLVTAWVKTDANTAGCNLPAGHGYSNGKFDVHWSSGGVNYVRYGVDGTISTNALSLDGGAGDDFPASATANVVVCKQTEVTINLDGDNCKMLGLFCRSNDEGVAAHVDLQDASNATVGEFDLVSVDDEAEGLQHAYNFEAGDTNVVTGNVITKAKISNGSDTDSATIFILALVDATP